MEEGQIGREKEEFLYLGLQILEESACKKKGDKSGRGKERKKKKNAASIEAPLSPKSSGRKIGRQLVTFESARISSELLPLFFRGKQMLD